MSKKTAIIIGAGPAGLTAAYELLDKTDVVPLVFEMSDDIGGISKTVNYKGNRIDIGGHRFFSKSDRVMRWWQNLFPLQGAPARDDRLLGRQVPLATECLLRDILEPEPVRVCAPDPEETDGVMLVRGRCSRIFFLRRFFDYPITLSLGTVRNLGAWRIVKIGVSYVKARLAPIRDERSLQDFFINRFGDELYRTFFKDYTEKVWGVPCRDIKPEWGAQRIKGLSVTKTLLHALRKLAGQGERLQAKKVETSLIEQFYYPKLGPGQIWEEAAQRVVRHGGQVVRRAKVVGIEAEGEEVRAVLVRDEATGVETRHAGDYFLSTMPVRELVAALGEEVPAEVREVAKGLKYRDFITVGLLLKRLAIRNETGTATVNGIVPDNWIYIQEREVKLGRLQIFNNWSPYLVRDPDTVWIGLEYFCNEGDELWGMEDAALSSFAISELASIGIIDATEVLDSTVLRMPKAYPAYFGSYDRFDVIRGYTDRFENLFLIGRNGMHRYNNADHSMLTAMAAVENIASGCTVKDNIWGINAEEEYHEEKTA
ncbi:NAD(P)/FAD-dependent oxidoreductase [Geomonas sp. Red69]|uniref:NAD(P)/FAD-dependent oxidoreductase n=1 Tax=Geomonas diazotrophica TaxID=2843197 RepID=UPI001C10F297|nr:NAD(P)/FAD-dependent oxidoreductase [Geomonas diazotrophica]MBU5636455.1 NAD(P)/FAD-dependent oxidoreductase [Geomonas diazotrophica]